MYDGVVLITAGEPPIMAIFVSDNLISARRGKQRCPGPTVREDRLADFFLIIERTT